MEPAVRVLRVTRVRETVQEQVTAARAGEDDVAAFYVGAFPRLVAVLLRVCGTRDEAEEVAQEAFVRLVPRWDTVRRYDDHEAWVRSVAFRIATSRWRKARSAASARLRLGPPRSVEPPDESAMTLDRLLADLSVEHRLAQELQAALRADAAATSVPPVAALLSRSRRRRSQRGAGIVAAVVLLVMGGIAGTSLLDGGGTSTSYVTPVDEELVLDRGTDAEGPWRIVSSRADGYCIQHIRARGSGGSCGQAEPEKLTEGSIFSVEDEGEPFTIAAGPTPDSTAEVVVELEDGSVHRTSPVRHGKRTVYVLRLPDEATITEIQARDAGGAVIDRHGGFPSGPPGELPPGGDIEDPGARTLVDQFRAFAANPSPSLLAETPIDPQVQLGLGTEIVKTLPSTELIASAKAWVLPVEMYAAAVGPSSALDVLAKPGPVQITVGPHPHCASPPRPAPAGLEAAQRISVQPTSSECLRWYTVDFFLVDGLVKAITVDYWEP